MKVNDMTQEEILQAGMNALEEKLGPVDFIKFWATIFFIEDLFAILERAAQRRGCEEEREQENCPLPAADSEDDRADECRREGSTLIETVSSVGQIGDNNCKNKTVEELHLNGSGDKE